MLDLSVAGEVEGVVIFSGEFVNTDFEIEGEAKVGVKEETDEDTAGDREDTKCDVEWSGDREEIGDIEGTELDEETEEVDDIDGEVEEIEEVDEDLEGVANTEEREEVYRGVIEGRGTENGLLISIIFSLLESTKG